MNTPNDQRENSYQAWLAARAAQRRWRAQVDAMCPPATRRIPRDPDEARLLRAHGTPEALIGPAGRAHDETSRENFWRTMGRRARKSV